ncbi:hypothetical protein GALMADRAFT_147609 [Galerina marginata CBS 339.88]|uniref:Hydrophobin n=1 Tax=Galerina marginata (strain CBS 339.88) TaxID=685588 RepID=A0A067S7C6_GALM3|nr:hypothetical protein GALMADRAFT_147609 [Galerina marginata CBS 339.88]
MITALIASVAVAVASPTFLELESRQSLLCSSSTAPDPVCCATSILSAAGLDCAPQGAAHPNLQAPNPIPTDIPGFNSACAAIGQRARCCFLAIAGFGVLCSPSIY